ncbi:MULTISPECIES: NAD-dependent epimerase/dehydratase family protein [Sphingobacterium]|uniref:NAD-dependent epimerase/dehydratase family protein n=1 Tax=Sphingobacterium TaxID=28453 RepID=UPI00162857A4|nr:MULTISPECIES: NAD-dependent epimerase/dehydratase family protein [Sphingobacterium]MBV2226445.1 NAD-dependent epimerase/dehydratase family protein [Sphingobacterium mizutaii]
MILVTGGTGFLGSTLLQYLIDEGHSVIALKRSTSIIPDPLKSSSLIQWVDAEITDYFALEDIIPKVDQVYHCAAKVSYQKEDAAEIIDTNVEGTKHIVNLCLEHQKRLLHVSSIAALGFSKKGLPVTENDKWEFNPKISKYSLAKYESEMEVWRGVAEGLDAVIVNPSVIMGIGWGEKGSRAIFNMVNKGNKIYPLGSVGIVDVSDVAKIMILLMNSDISGQRFILNAENISNQDLLTKISELMNKPAPHIKATSLMLSVAWRLAKLGAAISGKKPALTKESARAANSKLQYDNSKIKETLGYTFKPLDQTLREVCEAYYL